jgi:hypothetical protein
MSRNSKEKRFALHRGGMPHGLYVFSVSSLALLPLLPCGRRGPGRGGALPTQARTPYFVDAPEINLRYPERTREQSEYFGVTLDESMSGGRMARDFVPAVLGG